MTAEVRINDLFEQFVWRNIRGKVADRVQDIISSGIHGEVSAEQLKLAKIQVITLQSRAIFYDTCQEGFTSPERIGYDCWQDHRQTNAMIEP